MPWLKPTSASADGGRLWRFNLRRGSDARWVLPTSRPSSVRPGRAIDGEPLSPDRRLGAGSGASGDAKAASGSHCRHALPRSIGRCRWRRPCRNTTSCLAALNAAQGAARRAGEYQRALLARPFAGFERRLRRRFLGDVVAAFRFWRGFHCGRFLRLVFRRGFCWFLRRHRVETVRLHHLVVGPEQMRGGAAIEPPRLAEDRHFLHCGTRLQSEPDANSLLHREVSAGHASLWPRQNRR